MNASSLTIWCNAHFPEPATRELLEGIKPHRLITPGAREASNLVGGAADPLLAQADVAFGQPDPKQIVELPKLRWIHLTSAGYTRYDTPAVRDGLKRRGAILTNSSMVYDEPCAEHVLAMILAVSRRLPQSWAEQATTRAWKYTETRIQSRLLGGQTFLLLGFGAIARRLLELLSPMKVNAMAVRRTVTGSEPIPTFPYHQLRELIPQADHIVNLLPANPTTERLFDAGCVERMRQTAIFYNIGRGSTVDQIALQTALETDRIGGAYLDVTDPEPLPPDHPLWLLPNCWITPHTAGGHANEFERLVRHFLTNLRCFERSEPLLDRIV
ncbi:MAG TPA: D-2-hydroxyacid dehydrogenase [Tepidisphaeraceae bacterium]|jgi:phosphoglycerate dehydrogenase-like enzyme|nr:D-2-hydroxyacid dehydrogenase [Tepidisphaeraceae bacterium]